MKFSLRNIRKIILASCVIFSILSAVLGTFYVAVLIQYPPARANWSFIVWSIFLYGTCTCSLWGVTKLSKTRIGKDTYYFIFIVVGVSLMTMVLGNIGLKLGLSFDQIVAISILISTPLSCLIAGYSKKTVITRLKKLGLDQGVTLFAIVLLALVPIISYPTLIFSFHQTLYVLPNLVFQTTPNTTMVNGQIKGSTFLAEISALQNEIFEAERFVDANMTNWGNESVTFQFAVSSFNGSLESIRQLELDVLSSSNREKVFFIDNEGVLQCNQTTLLLQTSDKFSFSIRYVVAGQAIPNIYFSISVSIFEHNTILKTVNIILNGS
jgi:hypothetical protein